MKHSSTLTLAAAAVALSLLSGCYGAVKQEPIPVHAPSSRVDAPDTGVTLDRFFREPNQDVVSSEQPGEFPSVRA